MGTGSRDDNDADARQESGDPGVERLNKGRDSEDFQGWQSRGYLPHFDNSKQVQHVTVHLADSLPKSAIERIDQVIKVLPETERAIERRKRLHDWVDAGYGSCLLKQEEFAKIIRDTFLYFDKERYHLHSWVVMPNHFHVLFQSLNNLPIAKIVASWKRFTATEIKKQLRAKQQIDAFGIANLRIGTAEPLWHRKYWDRYIRNEKHFLDTVNYIHQNPVKAGLCKVPEDWKWSSAFRAP